MKAIIGKKLKMTQIFAADGTVVPVTLVEAGPCVVTEVKTAEKDKYNAVAIGFGKQKHQNKPEAGHFKELGAFQVVREFRTQNAADVKRGDVLDVSAFTIGDHVDVIGVSKGRGFQGVVKRHGFGGAPKTHGHKHDLRAPGSIGAGGVQRVFKGMRMAGRMGGDRVTVKNLEVMQIDAGKNILAIRGAVPGAFGSTILINAREAKTIWLS